MRFGDFVIVIFYVRFRRVTHQTTKVGKQEELCVIVSGGTISMRRIKNRLWAPSVRKRSNNIYASGQESVVGSERQKEVSQLLIDQSLIEVPVDRDQTSGSSSSSSSG